jgi:hypothetical protein
LQGLGSFAAPAVPIEITSVYGSGGATITFLPFEGTPSGVGGSSEPPAPFSFQPSAGGPPIVGDWNDRPAGVLTINKSGDLVVGSSGDAATGRNPAITRAALVTLLAPFFRSEFTQGVPVTTMTLPDGTPITTRAPGASGSTPAGIADADLLKKFFAFDPASMKGVFQAVGDWTGNAEAPSQPALQSTITFNQNTLTLTELYSPFRVVTDTGTTGVTPVVPEVPVVPIVVVPVVPVVPIVVVPVVPDPGQVLPLATQTNQQLGISAENTLSMFAVPMIIKSEAGNTLKITSASITGDIAGTVLQASATDPTVATLTGVSGTLFDAGLGALPSSGTNRATHLVWGAPSVAFPGSGTFMYNFVSTTSPTYGNGATAAGTLTGSVVINFGTLRAGVEMSVAMPDQTFTIRPAGGTATIGSSASAGMPLTSLGLTRGFSASGPFTLSSNPVTCGGSACMTRLEGRLLGDNAAFTGVVFRTELNGGNSLSGAGVGKR